MSVFQTRRSEFRRLEGDGLVVDPDPVEFRAEKEEKADKKAANAPKIRPRTDSSESDSKLDPKVPFNISRVGRGRPLNSGWVGQPHVRSNLTGTSDVS